MKHKTTLTMAAVMAVMLAAVVAGCGGADTNKTSNATGNSTDRAFVAEMIPHHESAIEMAKIAQQRGRSQFVKQLAANIVKTQDSEIAIMKTEDAKLAKDGLKKGKLNMSTSMMDMDTKALKTAAPFDPAFLKMMLPHHKGAVEMAKVELDKGKDPALKQLAQEIIDGQSREITQMNQQLN